MQVLKSPESCKVKATSHDNMKQTDIRAHAHIYPLSNLRYQNFFSCEAFSEATMISRFQHSDVAGGWFG